ncbi:Pycsar system effector family protein [Nocardia rhizosphaerihabitans]|uniref:Pycsar system effector family protein n=1 Tax=Nocardia rhizosphaerihabitans TaxID=1691570 RepID=UPI00366CE26D
MSSYLEILSGRCCADRMKILTRQLRPVDDLNTALRTISEFNRIITAADTKSGLLLTADGFALTGLIAAGRTPMNAALAGVAIALAVSLIVCMGYLAATMSPRLRDAGAGNWFCFPTFPTDTDERPTAPVLADHAWRQVGVLAEIAQRKYRRLGVALRWSAISLVLFFAWFAAALLGATT